MQHKSPELMDRILNYAEKTILETGRTPSTAEIGRAVGVTRSTVFKYLVAMDAAGRLSYHDGRIETERTRLISADSAQAGILGPVPCGAPQSIEECVEKYVPLPVSIFGDGELYILRASGESMTGAGIDDGDLVVVRRQDDAKPGDIVVALVENQNTLKRLMWNDEQRCWYLHPENPAMSDIPAPELTVQGVARQVIKQL